MQIRRYYVRIDLLRLYVYILLYVYIIYMLYSYVSGDMYLILVSLKRVYLEHIVKYLVKLRKSSFYSYQS